MDEIYIGKVVNTHGIKGEIRILSDFLYKEKAFKVDTHIIIDGKGYKITSYRRHKNYEMISLDGYSNINDVLFLKGKKVYKKRRELNLLKEEILDSDLVSYKVIEKEGKSGIIKEIFYASHSNKILRVLFDREVLIPFSSPMIKKIDPENKKIEVELIDGMI